MFSKLFLLIAIISLTIAQPQDLLDEMYSFLEIKDSNFHFLLQTQPKSQNPLKCLHNVLPRRVLSNKENVFDSGYDSCGWEVSRIMANCDGKALFDLQFELRKVLFENELKRTNLILNAHPSRSIEIPSNRHISMVRLGYQANKPFDYLSEIVLQLDDSSERRLSCAPGHSFRRTNLLSLSRVDGFRISYANKRISNLDFYINTIALKDRNSRSIWNLSYSEMLKRFKIELPRIEDKFVKRGPFGKLSGPEYENSKFFGDWIVKEISVEVPNSDTIGSLSLKLVNGLFMYDVTTPLCGNESPNPAHLTVVQVPANAYISWINIDLNPLTKRVRGLQFFYSNGEMSQCFGLCMPANQRSNANSNDVYFTNKEHLIGFHGHATNKGLESLGFLISLERTENLAKYF